MDTTKKCEKCGADTEYRIEGSTEGFFCNQCDWALVTTRISEIAQDITKYKMYLLSADPNNKEQVKLLSEVANVNFLESRRMAKEKRPLIIQDEALVIDKARKVFDKAFIRYEIEPNFPY